MEGGVRLCAHASITQRESCRLVHTFTQVARQRRTGVQIIPRPMNAQERTDPPPQSVHTPPALPGRGHPGNHVRYYHAVTPQTRVYTSLWSHADPHNPHR